MASYGGSTGQKEFINADILTRNVQVDELAYTVSGEGLFDDLMETATKHLQMQFEANRIRKEDYATAYVDIYKATLQAALQAWVTKLQDDENDAKLELLACQAKLACAQATSEEERTEQIKAQTEQIKYQTEYVLPKQVEHTEAQTEQIEAQTGLVEEQTNTQECQTKLVCAQHREEEYKISDVLPAQKANIEAQTAHTGAQTELVGKQSITETAKEALIRKQIESLNEDFKQKVLKLMLDGWQTGFSVAKDNATVGSVPSIIGGNAIADYYNKFIAPELDLNSRFNPSTGIQTVTNIS